MLCISLLSLHVRDSVSHPYKTVSKVIILCFNIYAFGQKGIYTVLNYTVASIPEISLLLISQRKKF
jgi:hypothetical protein